MIENALTEYHDRGEIERSLAIFHIHNYEDVDIDDVITELAFLKGRRPALFLSLPLFTPLYFVGYRKL